MKFVQVLVALVVLFLLSVGTVFVIKDWGPVQAAFEYAGGNAVLKAGGVLAAVVILLLVALYLFGKLATFVGLTQVAKSLTNIRQLLP